MLRYCSHCICFFKMLNTRLRILFACQTFSLMAGYQINAQILESRTFSKISGPEKYNIIYHFIKLAQGNLSPSILGILTFRGPWIMTYSYNKTQRDTLFPNFILIKYSTCFGQITFHHEGAQHCAYSNRYLSGSYVDCLLARSYWPC